MSDTLPPDLSGDAPVESVPFLGPIRARALRKAGLDTVGALRAASMEQLTAVRGITEIKARQVLDFLKGAPAAPAPAEPAPPVAEVGPPLDPLPLVPAQPAAPLPPAPPSKSAPVATLPAQPYELLVEAANAAHALLSGPDREQLGKTLLKQLQRVAELPETCAAAPPLKPKRGERAAVELRSLLDRLADARRAPQMKAKARERLAEDIRERRRNLQEVLGKRGK
jgi:hypothetical protein